MNPIDVINSIREDEYSLGKDGRPKPGFEVHLKRTHRMAEQLSDGLYERSDHFIFELIQNAEDNAYAPNVTPKIKFLLLDSDPTNTPGSKGCLCVFNNEKGFDESNIKAICDFNASTKKGKKSEGYIGEKGLGFKSVFMVSDSPHIYSNGYQFKFLKEDPISTVGYVIPYWLDEMPDVVSRNKKSATAILLPLKEKDDNYLFIKQQLEKFSPETLLFLKTLKTIDIETTEKEKIIECEVNGDFKMLSHVLGEEFDHKQFWVKSKRIDVPNDIQEDKREGVESTEITIAFPLDGVTGEERVFSYLPTEERPGFPFHINADFLLPSSRESILKNKKWNNWLLRNVAAVVAEGLLGLIKDKQFCYQAYAFIPLPKHVSTRGSYKEVCEKVKDILGDVECVVGDDGALYLPGNSIRSSEELRMLLQEAKPSFFDEVTLIHNELSAYVTQLDFIGCKSTKNQDVVEMFEDDTWVSKHDDNWLIEAYDYLIKLFTRSQPYLNFNIVRSDQNEFVAPSLIYQPVDKETEKELDKIPSEYRSGIKFIDEKLFKKINSKGSQARLLKLQIEKFSTYVYLRDVFINHIQENLEGIKSQEFKSLFNTFLNLSSSLDSDEFEEVASEMPVMLDDESVALKNDISTDDLVTPHNWDTKTGWQHLFESDGDREHFHVSNDYYTKLDRKLMKRYFSSVGITEFPKLKEITVAQYGDKPEGLQESYYQYIETEFLRNYSINSTRAKKIETYVLPSFSTKDNEIRKGSREALIKWLNSSLLTRNNRLYWKQDLQHAKGLYFYRKIYSKTLDSAVLSCLRSIAWVNTTNGLQKPGHVFLPDDTVKRIFGNKLPFLKDKLHASVINLVGINKGATEETLIKFLSDMQTDKEVSKSTLKAVYSYFDNHCSDYDHFFDSDSLIYVPQKGGKWLKSSEVIWTDASAVVGDAFGWLDSYYTDSLKQFFIKKLNVQESVDDKSLIDAWLRIQDDIVDKGTVENILKLAVPAALRAIESSENEWLQDFVENALVWTQDDTWVDPSQVYVPDNPRLRRLFKGRLCFVWRPDSLAHGRLEPFYEALNIKEISLEVEYSIANSQEGEQVENSYLTKDTARLLGYALFNLDKEGAGYFDDAISHELLKSLVFCHEVALDEFRVTCTIDSHNAYIDDYSAFWDKDTQTLYFDKTADREDILDDIEDQVAKYLWGNKYKTFKDSVRKLIGASEKRSKKVRNDTNWSLPREKLTQLNELINEPEKPRVKKTEDNSETTEKQSSSDLSTNTKKESEDQPDSENNDRSTSGQPKREADQKSSEVFHVNGRGSTSNRGSGQNTSRNKKQHEFGDESGSKEGNSRTQAPRSGYKAARGGKSRSSGIANSINQARRNRMRSYVYSELTEDIDSKTAEEQQNFRKELGEKGELIVLRDLESKGWKAKRMPPNNPGYDIEALNAETGELFFVEVKGESFTWCEKGVGISSKQYQKADKEGESFILAIVENLRQGIPLVTYIKDPLSYITEYRFDDGWRDLSTNIQTIRTSEKNISDLERLCKLTDSDECRLIIEFCDTHEFPLPDVGLELVDDSGRVMDFELELAWEEEKMGILLSESSDDECNEKMDNWKIYSENEINDMKELLVKIFSTNTGCDD